MKEPAQQLKAHGPAGSLQLKLSSEGGVQGHGQLQISCSTVLCALAAVAPLAAVDVAVAGSGAQVGVDIVVESGDDNFVAAVVVAAVAAVAAEIVPAVVVALAAAAAAAHIQHVVAAAPSPFPVARDAASNIAPVAAPVPVAPQHIFGIQMGSSIKYTHQQ